MTEPLVSIIMPCYNAEKYLNKAIESIVNQSYQNLEILIANDCSTDSTLQIINRFAEKDHRIKVVNHRENKKIVSTLNELISIASGQYIARMDADDVSERERIEQQVCFLEDHPDISGCGTNAWVIDTFGNKVRESDLPCKFDEIQYLLKFYCSFYHPTMMIRTSVYKNNKYDENFLYAEDYELWCRLVYEEKLKLVNLDEKLFCYRVFPNQTSKVNEKRQWEKSALIFEKYNIVSKKYEHEEVLFLRESSACSTNCRDYILETHKKLRTYPQQFVIPIEEKLLFYANKTHSYKLFAILCLSHLGLETMKHIMIKHRN